MRELAHLKRDLLKKLLIVSLPVEFLLLGFGRELVALAFAFGIFTSWMNLYFLSVDLSKTNFSNSKAPPRKLIQSYFFRFVFLGLAFSLVFLYKLPLLAFVIGFFAVKLLLILEVRE